LRHSQCGSGFPGGGQNWDPETGREIALHSSVAIFFIGRIDMTKLKALLRDERGASLVEYSILIGIITATAIASIVYVGSWVGTKWGALETVLKANP